MRVIPSRDIQAIMGSVEFYRTQKTLASGTYEIVEHDGEHTFAVVDRYNNVTWFDRSEYDEALHYSEEQDRELNCSWVVSDDDREELMDSWDDAMIHQESIRLADECHAGEPEDLTDTEFNQMVSGIHGSIQFDPVDAASSVTEPKTLGQLLRAGMHVEDKGYQLSSQSDYDKAVATRNRG